MTESLFWWYVEKRRKKRIKTKDLKEMTKIFEEKILNLAKVVSLYFEKDPPENNRFYAHIGDCYDGICVHSEDYFNFFETIIMSGKNKCVEFIANPFRGDIMFFLKRDISCGNSSCLYLDFSYIHEEYITFTSWNQLSNNNNYPSVELCNKIFDIINP